MPCHRQLQADAAMAALMGIDPILFVQPASAADAALARGGALVVDGAATATHVASNVASRVFNGSAMGLGIGVTVGEETLLMKQPPQVFSTAPPARMQRPLRVQSS